jgi:transcriptional regulator with XRE-family HTH domain
MKNKIGKVDQENNQDNEISGAKLIHWLNQKAFEQGMSKLELSKYLGVSNSYLTQLQSGEKLIRNVGRRLY